MLSGPTAVQLFACFIESAPLTEEKGLNDLSILWISLRVRLILCAALLEEC